MSDLGNKEIFSKNLRYYMSINKKNRNDICKDLQIPYSTLTDWYNGNIYPRIDKIELLANYFDIRKSDLVEEKIDKNIQATNKKSESNVFPTINIPKQYPVLGKISAGLPILADENLEGYMYAPSSKIQM